MIPTSRLAAITLTIFSLPLAAHATDSTLDGAFVTTISPGLTPDGYVPPPTAPNWSSGTGAVNAVALQSDGKIIAGGNISRYQAPPAGSPQSSLKRLNSDGTLDTAFGAIASTLADSQGQTEVNKILTVASDKLYVGGVFTSYDGVARGGVLRLDANGTLDTGFNAAGISNSNAFSIRYVLALAEQPDGKLLVGGGFNRANGTFRPNLARFNDDGSLDTSFNPNAALGDSSFVGDISVLPNGQILVAGGRNRPGGGGTPLLLRLNSDGSLDPSLSPSFDNEFGDIDELLVLPDGRMLIGGDFSFQPSGTSYYFACLLPDGSLDTSFMTNVGSGPNGWAGGEIALQPDGTIFVGGIFKSWNGQPRASIARLLSDGTLDTAFAPAPYINDNSYTTHFYSFAFQPDGKLVAGGWFPRVSDPAVETYNLTRFVNEFATGPGTLRAVSATATTTENAGSVALQVSRFGGLIGAVSVDYTLTPLNAIPGTDYTPISGTLTWATGVGGIQSITVPILQDTAQDGLKTFQLTLSNPTGGATLPPANSTTLVGIRDDDAPPVIVLNPVAVTLDQGANFSLVVFYDSVLPATVQWQRDPDGPGGPLPFANVPGATSLVYFVSNSDPTTHGGTYRAVVTNPNGSVTSAAAEVAIAVPTGSVVASFAPVDIGTINLATPDSSGRILSLTSTGLRRLAADGTVDPTASFGLSVASNTATSVLPLADGRILVGGSFTSQTHQPSSTATSISRLVRLNADATGTVDTGFSVALSNNVTALAAGTSGTFYVGVSGASTSGNGLLRFLPSGAADPTWTPAANTIAAGTSGNVILVKELADGKVLVSHRLGSTYRLSRLTSTGALDSTFGTGGNIDFGTSNWINGLDVLPDGRIAVSARFNVDLFTTAQRYLAILNSDGKPDSSFQFGNGVLGSYPFGVAYRDGRLLVWGAFTTVNGFPLGNLLRLNLDGSVDTTFSIGAGASGNFGFAINTAFHTTTGDIFIGGSFTSFKGVPRNRAALLVGNPQISAVGFAPPRVTTIEAAANLALTVRRYGSATEAASITYTTADGTALAGTDYTAVAGSVNWGPGDSADKTVLIPMLNDADIEVSKTFRVLLGTATGPLSPAASATITILDNDTPVTYTVSPVALTNLIAGGSLSLTATTTSPTPTTYQWFLNGVAIPGATTTSYAKNPVTAADAGLYTLVATNAAGAFTGTPALVVIRPQPGRPAVGQATTGRPVFGTAPVGLVVANDGSVYVGGNFSASLPNNVPQANFFRVKPDGSTDTPFTYTPGAAVTALARQPDGKILLAGPFANRVVRLNADGTVDTDFATALGASLNTAPQLNDFAFDSTGRIYVGGASYLARLSSAGALDTTYTPAVGGTVTAITVQADDKLVVGGSITTLAGSSVSRLGRLEINGARDTTFVSAIGGGAIYNDLLVLSDGRLLAAGSGFANSASFALVNSDGSFGSNIASSNQVYRLAQAPNGKILRIQTSATSANYVARLLGSNPLPSPGSSDFDATFNLGTGPNAEARALAIGPDGGVWIAGQFTTVDSVATGGIAKLNGDLVAPAIANQPVRTDVNTGGTARLSVGAIGTGLTYQWFKNGTPLADDTRISGATTAILTITGLLATDDDTYTVAVTGGTPATTATSNSAKLNVLAAPLVATSPASLTPALGSTVTLAADVLAATPATYIWTRNGVPIIDGGRYSGATTATLVITGATNADDGAYTLTVTNSLDTAATAPATLAVAQVAHLRAIGPTTNIAVATTSSNNVARAFLHLPDGRTLVAVVGNVTGTNASSSSQVNLVLIQPDGTVSATPAGTFNNNVLGLERLPDGKILVVGAFTQVANVAGAGRSYLARLNADLTLDTTFAPSPVPTAAIQKIITDSFGRILLGGSFTNYGGVTGQSNLVRLTADGALDPTFTRRPTSTVNDLLRQKDGKVLVGGGFSSLAGDFLTARGLYRLDADGNLDTGFTPDFPAGNSISALALDSTGRIIAARTVPTLVRLLPTGVSDPTFTFSESLNGQISSLLAFPDGRTLVGGSFTTPTNRLFAIDASGARDTTFDVGTGLASSVNTFSSDTLGRTWVGGLFNTYNAVNAPRILVLQGTGPILDFTIQPSGQIRDLGATATFTAAATANNGFTYQWRRNGLLLADGGRISGTATPTLTIAGLLATDAADYHLVITSPSGISTFASLTSATARLAVLAAPEILVGPSALTRELGGSATFSGNARGAGTLNYQWLLNGDPLADGTTSGLTITGATTPSLTVSGITFDQAGTYRLRVSNTLGQAFSTPAVLTVERLPGGLAAGVAQPSPNNAVLAILRLADGSMLVGGQFTSITINGVANTRGRIARFLTDGTLDPNFTPSFSSDVRALAQDSSGRIFVGGGFTSVTFGSTTTNRTRVARLTSSLALDTDFDTSTAGPNNQINALAPTGDGGVYVGGAFSFNLVGATAVNRVARLSATGALDTGFAAPTNPVNNEVKALLLRSDGKLYVGGTFGTTLLLSTGPRDTAFSGATSGQAFLHRSDGSLAVAGGNPYFSIVNGDSGAALKNYVTGHFLAVSSVAQQSDGKLLSGSYGVLKRTNPATDLDDPGFVGGDNYINALALDGAGRIWAGGAFSTFAGVARSRLAILNGGEFESQSGPLTPQIITFPALADRNTLDAPFNLTATSDSGLPVAYAISGPATLSGSTVTLTGAPGTVTITATQAGNATTAAATPVIRSFAVIAADPLADFLATAGIPANLRGPNDDADNDGLDNLLEYALDLNPNGNGGAYTGTPPTSVQTSTELSYTYRRVRNDVTYIVETSSALIGGTWTSVGVTQGIPAQDGTTTASIPITPGSQFLRLSVSR